LKNPNLSEIAFFKALYQFKTSIFARIKQKKAALIFNAAKIIEKLF
jgi:hypothetical protein